MALYIGSNPNEEKVYVVILKTLDDAESFYEDMETPGGPLYIPDRSVECVNRRPISRCTHYRLSHAEAEQIRNDPRVENVTILYSEIGAIKEVFSGVNVSSSSFNKATAASSTDLNWGLLRCLRRNNIPLWGAGNILSQSATIMSDVTGKNVDIVVADDGAPYPTVLEYSENSDGTGYTRMVEYNWLQHAPEVQGIPAGNYNYVSNRVQQHGGHCSTVSAGNTQGWARDASIFNIKFADTNFADYVKLFHRYKPVNPLTGVKNPTIMNNSWGTSLPNYLFSANRISYVVHKGVQLNPTSGSYGNWTWNATTLNNARVLRDQSQPYGDAETEADMVDLIREGVIVVASAGNSYTYMDKIGGADYNNWYALDIPELGGTYQIYYHRGGSPQCASDGTYANSVICVGATGQHNETAGQSVYSASAVETLDYKAEFSNYGPRVDVYAPGSAIQANWSYPAGLYNNGATDLRTSAYSNTNPFLANTQFNNYAKCPGTSMAGPQVVGILACLAEREPTMNQAWAKQYLDLISSNTVITTVGGVNDYKDNGVRYNANSTTRHVYLNGTRLNTNTNAMYGMPWPRTLGNIRPRTGVTYPRTKTVQRENSVATFVLSVDNSNVNAYNQTNVTVSTTNIPDGTQIQYLITGKPIYGTSTTVITPNRNNPQSGVHNTPYFGGINPDTGQTEWYPSLNNFILNTAPNTTITFSTEGASGNFAYSVSSYSYFLEPRPGSFQANSLTSGNSDDGYSKIEIPYGGFDFWGNNYSCVYVSTNSYFSVLYGHQASSNFTNTIINPCVYIEPGDNINGIIYTDPTANPATVIWYEGQNAANAQQRIIWRAAFNQGNPPNTVILSIGRNDFYGGISVTTRNLISDINSFSKTNTFKVLSDANDPSGGTVDQKVGIATVYNNQAVIPLYIITNEAIEMNVRLNMYPAPNVYIALNY